MGGEFPTRAFIAFTVALATSVWALFSDIGRPYLPSVPIVVYGIFLYANRETIANLASDSLRDSPYFLGFLLTMFGLFKLFNDVSFNFTLFGRNPSLLTQQVGGAVLTTIIGLFVRQALLLLIPDVPPKEDDRLAALAAAIQSHAVAFEMARQDFFRDMAAEQRRHIDQLTALREDVARRAPGTATDDGEDLGGDAARRGPLPSPTPIAGPSVGPSAPFAPPIEAPREDRPSDARREPPEGGFGTPLPASGALGPYAPEEGDASVRRPRARPVPPPAFFGRER